MSVQCSPSWVINSDATTHMHSSKATLSSCTPSPHSSIIVGNATRIPVTSHGQTFLPTTASKFDLNNVLVVPSIVCNLLSIPQFTRNNYCSFEFDAFGFSVKDHRTRRVNLRSNSAGDLYTISAAVLRRQPLPTPSLLSLLPCGINVLVILLQPSLLRFARISTSLVLKQTVPCVMPVS